MVLHEFEGQQVTLTTSRNVSQRRAQEKQLRRGKRFALNNSQTPIVWARRDSKLEYANHAAASLLGYAPHDLLRVPLEQIEIEGAGEVWEHHWQELQFKKRTSRYGHFLHKNGRPIPVQINQDFMDFEGDQLAVVQFWDISDRIAREAVLEAERSRFKAIVNLAPYGVVLIDQTGSPPKPTSVSASNLVWWTLGSKRCTTPSWWIREIATRASQRCVNC